MVNRVLDTLGVSYDERPDLSGDGGEVSNSRGGRGRKRGQALSD